MIGIIGYRNQSLKILNVLTSLKYKDIIVYCRKKTELVNKQKNIIYTNNINLLNDCKIIFISSPSNTHYKYIKQFTGGERYIFCEKPAAVTLKEINYLQKIKKVEKEKIYFNFNYIKSNVYEIIKKEIKNKKNGKLMHVSIYASHGLFFKKGYTKDWRLKNNSIFENISGNLGVHYINFLINILGKLNKIRKVNTNFSKKGDDTSLISLEFINNETATIFLSYATVYSKEMKFYFTNTLIEVSDDKIYKYTPRDTFDSKGLFIKPRKLILSNNGDLSIKSLRRSIEYFMKNYILNKKFKDIDFNNSLLSSEVLLKK